MKVNDVFIDGTSQTAKIRNPWLVLLFTFLTFGFYLIFWWYFVNREMRDLGLARQDERLKNRPGWATAAYTIGSALYIPLIWTIVTTTRRAQAAQRITVGKSLNGWVAGLLWLFTLTFGGAVYMQSQLNRVWRAPGMRPIGEQLATPEELAGDSERSAKLAQLHAAGCLSDWQYEAQKERLHLG